MSWLFGWRKKKEDENKFEENYPKQPPIDPSNEKSQQTLTFGSQNFRKALEAAETLEKSKYFPQLFELNQLGMKTNEMESELKGKSYSYELKRWQLRQLIESAQGSRASLEDKFKQIKADAETQNYREKTLYEDKLNKKIRELDEDLRREEAKLQREYEQKRAQNLLQIDLAHKNKMKEIESELRQKQQMEQENREIHINEIRANAEESRKTVMESIKTAGNLIGMGFSSLTSNKEHLVNTVLAGSLLFAGFYSAKYSMRTAFRYAEMYLGKPVLIRESSTLSALEVLRHPVLSARKAMRRASISSSSAFSLQKVIMSPAKQARLFSLAVATRNTRANDGFYRNVLLYGPPGTGKTMFGRRLAECSGMDFAIMSGGDVIPLGGEAVTAIHKLFDWSERNRRGLILFIDEAEAFLHHRSVLNSDDGGENNNGNSLNNQEHLRSTLNAFLQRSGTPSKRVMLMLASNEPRQFDWAVQSRMDTLINFPLPRQSERIRLMQQYLCEYGLTDEVAHTTSPSESSSSSSSSPSPPRRSLLEGLIRMGGRGAGQHVKVEPELKKDLEDSQSELFRSIIDRTHGFSGRELAKLCVAFQARAYSSRENGQLTRRMVEEEVRQAVRAFKKKDRWNRKSATSTTTTNLTKNKTNSDESLVNASAASVV